MKWDRVRAIVGVWGVVCCIGLALPAGAATGGFGFGGATVGALYPDLSGIGALLSTAGYGAIERPLVVAGGFGHGGALPGPFIGGRGWGGGASVSGPAGRAELAVGFGGLEIGAALGGNERSLLTLGVVLGAGGATLELWPPEIDASPLGQAAIRGIVPAPEPALLHRAFAGIEASIGMHVQLLPWLGFQLRLGYWLSPFGIQWGENGWRGDEASLDLSGPLVGLSIAFGGIGTADGGRPRPTHEARTVEQVGFVGSRIRIDHPVGDLTLTTWPPDSVQTPSEPSVRIAATKRAGSEEGLELIRVSIDAGGDLLEVRSALPARGRDAAAVELHLTVPAGIETEIVVGAGRVSLFDVAGSAAVKLGTGEVTVRRSAGERLALDLGVGDIRVSDARFDAAKIDLGTGGIDVRLHPGASATLDVSIGLGEFALGPFPDVPARRTDLIGGRERITIGAGASIWEFDIGIGRLSVGPSGVAE